jgi:hypothetical protein
MHPYPLEEISGDDALYQSKFGRLDGFQRNLEMLIKTVKADGALPIIFGFLQNREDRLSKNSPHLGKEKALVIGLQRTYAIMKDLANKYDVQFVDPRQELFPDEVFLDNCHLNEEGELIKARVLFEAVGSQILGLAQR